MPCSPIQKLVKCLVNISKMIVDNFLNKSWINHNWPFLHWNTNIAYFTQHIKCSEDVYFSPSLWEASSFTVRCHKNVPDNLRSRVWRRIKIDCFISGRVSLFVHNCYVNLNSPTTSALLSVQRSEPKPSMGLGISDKNNIQPIRCIRVLVKAS